MEKVKIVADSSADMTAWEGLPFAAAPLKIITDHKEYKDNAALDVAAMVQELLVYKGRSGTSCPSPEDWLRAFGDSETIFCLTITSVLSGSYNAAGIAKQLYEEMYPNRRVFVFDSRSTGPEMKLLMEHITQEVNSGKSADAVAESAASYQTQTGLFFMLESMKNLANNGRVNPLVAKAAGLLGIRMVGKAQDGALKPLQKCRGEEKALQTLVELMKEQGLQNGKVRIAHCLNASAAEKLKTWLLAALDSVDVEIYPCGGLCSFYAERGGLIVGFEKK